MDPRFLAHNAHLEGPTAFAAMDPHLRFLARQPFVFRSSLIDRLPVGVPGIYTVSGGRQIGKTTTLKQWMSDLLAKGVPAGDIAFFTGELIDDHHTLVSLLSAHLDGSLAVQYVILDEVSYIRDWDKGVKFLADAGVLQNVVLVLTGSDTVVIQDARLRFPGRRGAAGQVDFIVRPLSFRDTVMLKGLLSDEEQAILDAGAGSCGDDKVGSRGQAIPVPLVQRLFAEFDQYLAHGGFLTAINDLASSGAISTATLATYSDWIRGDVIKRGRQEGRLREILSSVIRHQGSQLSWNNMARDMSIDHPATVADYVAILASMDVLCVQAVLAEDKLAEAPRKPRKLHFADPFIFHAVSNWLSPMKSPYTDRILPCVSDPESSSKLVESVAVTHVARHHPTYFIKAAGEVDIAWVEGGRFHPVEVKWTGQLRPKDLVQVRKYANAKIWARQHEPSCAGAIPVEPLPVALWRFDVI